MNPIQPTGVSGSTPPTPQSGISEKTQAMIDTIKDRAQTLLANPKFQDSNKIEVTNLIEQFSPGSNSVSQFSADVESKKMTRAENKFFAAYNSMGCREFLNNLRNPFTTPLQKAGNIAALFVLGPPVLAFAAVACATESIVSAQFSPLLGEHAKEALIVPFRACSCASALVVVPLLYLLSPNLEEQILSDISQKLEKVENSAASNTTEKASLKEQILKTIDSAFEGISWGSFTILNDESKQPTSDRDPVKRTGKHSGPGPVGK